MSNSVNILNKLAYTAAHSGLQEHLLESASRHVQDVQSKINQSYDNALSEISSAFGTPHFDGSLDFSSADKANNLVKMPSWSAGKPSQGDTIKSVRLAYWINEKLTSYLVLRYEYMEKAESPIYYQLAIGTKQASKELNISIGKLKENTTANINKPNSFHKLFAWRKK